MFVSLRPPISPSPLSAVPSLTSCPSLFSFKHHYYLPRPASHSPHSVTPRAFLHIIPLFLPPSTSILLSLFGPSQLLSFDTITSVLELMEPPPSLKYHYIPSYLYRHYHQHSTLAFCGVIISVSPCFPSYAARVLGCFFFFPTHSAPIFITQRTNTTTSLCLSFSPLPFLALPVSPLSNSLSKRRP